MVSIAERFEEVKGDHTFRGLSSAGYGMAKQILMKEVKHTKPYGVFAKGTLVHELYQQKIFPEGHYFDEFTLVGMDYKPFTIKQKSSGLRLIRLYIVAIMNSRFGIIKRRRTPDMVKKRYLMIILPRRIRNMLPKFRFTPNYLNRSI